MSRVLAAALVATLLSATACAPSAPPDGSLPCDRPLMCNARRLRSALEASLPLAAFDEKPTEVDSGRECSENGSDRSGVWSPRTTLSGAIFERENLTGFSVVTYQGVASPLRRWRTPLSAAPQRTKDAGHSD